MSSLAIFGSPFSHTDEASFIFGVREADTKVKYFESIEALFGFLEQNPESLGVVPGENSKAGRVEETFEGFKKYPNIRVISEQKKNIIQAFLGLPMVNLSEIKTVASHPQAWIQSQELLEKLIPGISFEKASSTSAAALDLLKTQNRSQGIIGSPELAKVFDLKILIPELQSPDNKTTFYLVSGKICK